MPAETTLCDGTIAAVSARIRDRELSPLDLVEAQLDRIARINPLLHAYVTVTGDGARTAARRATEEIASGRYRGPLHGIPYAAKDLIDTAGIRTACGSKILAQRVPDADADVVRRLEQAGAVLVGKLVMTEFAGIGYHPSVTPPTNPWNAGFWTGQSSSGSGVAVAAGLCFGSLGSDTGGSLRYPAAACGVVGLRPTYGRVSRGGTFPLAESLDVIGPVTRTVADAAIMLRAIAGREAGDPTTIDTAVPDYLAALEHGCEGFRVGVVDSLVEGAEPPVRDAVRAAATALRDIGATLRSVRIDGLVDAVAAWATIFTAECLHAHERFYPGRAADYSDALRRFLEQGAEVRGVDYARAVTVRSRVGRDIDDLLRECDVLLLPTMGRLPPSLREFPADGIIPPESAGALLTYTAPFALTGHPAISLPCGFGPESLPIGLQLIAGRTCEATLLRVAAAYEAHTPWHTRRPRVAAGAAGPDGASWQ